MALLEVGSSSEDVPEWAAEGEIREFLVDPQLHGLRLDRVLASLVPEFSRNHLQSLVLSGHIRLDDVVASHSARKVRAGQRLRVHLVPTAESMAFRAEVMDLPVVHQDPSFFVIDKPAGLVVHPAPGNWSGTLLNGLLALDPGSVHLPRAGIVHRLDKDTSGLMVVARSLEAMTALVRDLAQHAVRRRYAALVWGVPTARQFSVSLPLGRDPVSRIKMATVAAGKPARTDVEVLAGREGISAIHCQLHTGRTHQIRVHLAAQGHPLLSDALYGGKPGLGLTRQALHAFELGFAHPITRSPMSFRANLPGDLSDAWAWCLSHGVRC